MVALNIHYQAIIPAPFGAVGIMMHEGKLVGMDLMPATHAINPKLLSLEPDSHLQNIITQLNHYFQRPTTTLDFPLAIEGSAFQQQVWLAIQAIPCGETRTYSDLARGLGSGARAVANACGANKTPLIIPCHRVVAKSGLGGFMQGKHPDFVAIKQWLIHHEAKH